MAARRRPRIVRSSADLIERAQAGDEHATQQLIEGCEKAIVSGMASAGVMRYSPDFDDAANETQFKIYRGVSGFKNESDICGWMRRIAKNTANDFGRSAGRLKALFERMQSNTSVSISHESTPEDQFDNQELATLVIDALPEKYRVVALAYYFDDEPTADIAERLFISESTVHVRLNRARKLGYAALSGALR